jgi:hypothetical protein
MIYKKYLKLLDQSNLSIELKKMSEENSTEENKKPIFHKDEDVNEMFLKCFEEIENAKEIEDENIKEFKSFLVSNYEESIQEPLVMSMGFSSKSLEFKNWALNVQRKIIKRYTPTNKKELEESMVEAFEKTKEKGKIRAVGHAHSWSDIFVDDNDALIDFTYFNNINDYKYNEEEKTVSVPPGATTGELANYFIKKGVCFHSGTPTN